MPKFISFGKSVKSVLFWSVISAAFIGPGTVTTCAMSGTNYGLSLLWALTFATFACIVLQETVARITIASGYTLGEVIAMRYAGRSAKYLVAGAIVFGCAAYQAGNILGAVAGLSILMNIKSYLLTTCVVVSASVILALGTEKSVSRFLGLLVALMGIMFIIVSLQMGTSSSDFITSSIIPSFPDNSGLLIISLVGTTIVPYNLFLGSGISKGQELLEMRIGTGVAILIGGIISMAILISGTIVNEEFSYLVIAETLNKKMGSWSGICFAIGLFAAGFTSSITAPLAAKVTVQSMIHKQNPHKYFYDKIWIGVMLVGFGFGMAEFKPIPVIILAQAINGLLLPLIAIFIVLIINDEKFIPSQYRNSLFFNIILLLVVGLTTFLGLNNVEKAILTVLDLTFTPEVTLTVMGSLSLVIVSILATFVFKR
jgi:manganese transport protein